MDRLAKSTSASDEEKFKFNWKDTTGDPAIGVSRVNAANVFTVSSMPWLDGIDNDGDLVKDASDTGQESKALSGRFGGPEIRIAGKINLNTASEATLNALGDGVGITGLASTVISQRSSAPIKSVAELVDKLGSLSGPDAKSDLEKRDLAFTRISNIASIRSDTFSIYGTVQYITPPRGTAPIRVVKSRRFWALVDRSPTAAYPPTSTNFIHPRILNFQWMD
jgi:hypothetical protein